MNRQELLTCYYEWLKSKAFKYTHEQVEYSKLLDILYSNEFTYTIARDVNRYNDGLELKKTFCWEIGIDRSYSELLGDRCSILEMMAALASRCETEIMADPSFGNRTSTWFMVMLSSMHLDNQTNDNFNECYVENQLSKMLNRQYSDNGDGGLFIINNSPIDVRTMEIWCQMNWYLSQIC